MKIIYDKIADAVYVRMKNGRVNKTIEINDKTIVDLDKNGKAIGVEFLDTSTFKSMKNNLKINIKESVAIL